VKDVEAQLWKAVFYRYLDDFRVRIRKYSAAAAADEPLAEESMAKARRGFFRFQTLRSRPDAALRGRRRRRRSTPSSRRGSRTTRA